MLKAQIIGNAIITISTFVVALVVMYAVNAMGLLRVSEEGELYGLDLHEHGISAYPEYVITVARRFVRFKAALRRLTPARRRAHVSPYFLAILPLDTRDSCNMIKLRAQTGIDRRSYDEGRGDHQAEQV